MAKYGCYLTNSCYVPTSDAANVKCSAKLLLMLLLLPMCYPERCARCALTNATSYERLVDQKITQEALKDMIVNAFEFQVHHAAATQL